MNRLTVWIRDMALPCGVHSARVGAPGGDSGVHSGAVIWDRVVAPRWRQLSLWLWWTCLIWECVRWLWWAWCCIERENGWTW